MFRTLDQFGVTYVIVGGLAATVYGASRVTFDIDVVPAWTNANLGRLAAALASMQAQLRVPGQVDAVDFPIDVAALRRFEVSTWRTAFGDLDVIIGIPTRERGVLRGYAQLKAGSRSQEAFGVVIRIASLDDIIESKAALARDVDLVALPELHRLRDEQR